MDVDSESSNSDPEEGPIQAEARLFREGVSPGHKVLKHKPPRRSYKVKNGEEVVNRRVAKQCPLCPSTNKQMRRHILKVHADESTKTRQPFLTLFKGLFLIL